MWSDTGIVLSHRKYGENYKLVSILTQDHGRTLGLSRIFNRNSFSLFSQVSVDLLKKNSSDSLGFWSKKNEKQNWIQVFKSEIHIVVCQSICLMLDKTLPQGLVYSNIFKFLMFLLEDIGSLSQKDISILYAYFEFLLLKETGFGFDLKADVYFISPPTGVTISKNLGLAHQSKLFKIPEFWHSWNIVDQYTKLISNEISNIELLDSLKITWCFINKNVLEIQNPFRNTILKYFEEEESQENKYLYK
jgi:hypothetical protein